MGRGLTPALRRSRGIGAEIAISQHDHCSRRPPLRVGSPPEASTAVCMHTTDNCHRYRHHRNKALLQVCVLWRRVCLNAPTSPTRVSQCVRPGALACVRPFAMTGSHKSGALHCDVRVAAQVRRVSPSGLPACLHPRMRRSEAARAWSTACWNVRRRVCCSGARTGVLCSGCTALSQTSGHSTVNFVPSPFRPR